MSNTRTKTDALARIEDYRAHWRQLVAALPEEDVTTPGRFAWVGDEALADGDFAGHLDEHEPDIWAWLAGQRG